MGNRFTSKEWASKEWAVRVVSLGVCASPRSPQAHIK